LIIAGGSRIYLYSGISEAWRGCCSDDRGVQIGVISEFSASPPSYTPVVDELGTSKKGPKRGEDMQPVYRKTSSGRVAEEEFRRAIFNDDSAA
jgi:hypothetical protein